jgi:hypothetical protein
VIGLAVRAAGLERSVVKTSGFLRLANSGSPPGGGGRGRFAQIDADRAGGVAFEPDLVGGGRAGGQQGAASASDVVFSILGFLDKAGL